MILPPTFSWFLAIRYLVTRWVNLIGMLGIALAVWAMIVVISVFSGFIQEARRGIEGASPQLLLTDLKENADFRDLEPALRKVKGVLEVAPRLHHYGMLLPHFGGKLAQRTTTIPSANSTANKSSVVIVGIDPELETDTTNLQAWLGDDIEEHIEAPIHLPQASFCVESADNPFSVSPGRVSQAHELLTGQGKEVLGEQDGILLGVMRINFGDQIIPGQRVDIISARYNHDDNEFKKIRIITHLSGVFRTQHRMLDLTVCMIDINLLRDHMGEGEAELITDVAIKVNAGENLATVAADLEAAVADLGGGIAMDFEDQNSTYLGAIDQERALMKIVLFAVMLVAGFLIFATMHMMVAQKVKDIGILTALGATASNTGYIFVLGGLAVGVAGCTIGSVIGCLSSYFLNDINELAYQWTGEELFPRRVYNLTEVPVDLDPTWITQVVLGALFLSILVSWLPARRAARLDPVKALMHE